MKYVTVIIKYRLKVTRKGTLSRYLVYINKGDLLCMIIPFSHALHLEHILFNFFCVHFKILKKKQKQIFMKTISIYFTDFYLYEF